MRPAELLGTLMLGLLAVGLPALAQESDPEALALLREGENALRSGSSIAVYRMELTRPEWSRTMRFRSHDDRQHDRFRMEMLSPRKTRGTLFLKQGDQLSMYLPKLRREIRISPVMIQDPWMGSDFNNQDLLEAGSVIEAYTHHIVAREGTGEAQIITIESVPKAEAAVVWDKLVQQVRSNGLPVQVDYVNCEAQVIRRMRFEDVKTLGGRRLPSRWVMTPMDKPGQRTEIVLEEIEFDVPIPPSLFQHGDKAGPGK